MSDRDHLFISYAYEDAVFARWLALRLTAEGYKVWIDQFQLLGGESWPRDIDEAIKTRSFRVLGLLSKFSIAKPNPLKERTLALNIAKQPGRGEFLIPLNVDGLSPIDLDWLSSDITFISFERSWAKGLHQLLALLDRENCPKSVQDGKTIVSALASSCELITEKPDLLVSNVCQFVQIPKKIMAYVVSPKIDKANAVDAQRDWAFYSMSPHRVLAFHPPQDDLATWLQAEEVREYELRTCKSIDGVSSENIVTALLRRCIETRCRARGLIWSNDAKAYYFSLKLGKNIPVRLPSGETTVVQSSGERTFFRVGAPKTPYRYWLAVRPIVVRNVIDDFAVAWRLGLHFTDTADFALPSSQRLSRRKHVTRNWRNRHWLVRHIAIIQYLATEGQLIKVGNDDPQQVVLDCEPLQFFASKGIDEAKLEALEDVSDDVPVDEGEFQEEDFDESTCDP